MADERRREVAHIPRSWLMADPRYNGNSRVVGKLFGIPAMGRYECSCGGWIMLPMVYDSLKPQTCEFCGRYHYWDDGRIIETLDNPREED